MRTMRPAPLLLAALLLAAAGCSHEAGAPEAAGTAARGVPATSAEASTADASGIPERYRKAIVRALERADRGENPTMACTAVVGRAASNPAPAGSAPDPERQRAFELCYVDSGARYIEALLQQVAADAALQEDHCARIASYAVIARGSLGSFAGNVQLDLPALDGKLVDRVRPGLMAHCPEHIAAIEGPR